MDCCGLFLNHPTMTTIIFLFKMFRSSCIEQCNTQWISIYWHHANYNMFLFEICTSSQVHYCIANKITQSGEYYWDALFCDGWACNFLSQFVCLIKWIRCIYLNFPKSHRLNNFMLIVEEEKMTRKKTSVRNV